MPKKGWTDRQMFTRPGPCQGYTFVEKMLVIWTQNWIWLNSKLIALQSKADFDCRASNPAQTCLRFPLPSPPQAKTVVGGCSSKPTPLGPASP